jgi:hypothetical protein
MVWDLQAVVGKPLFLWKQKQRERYSRAWGDGIRIPIELPVGWWWEKKGSVVWLEEWVVCRNGCHLRPFRRVINFFNSSSVRASQRLWGESKSKMREWTSTGV